MEYPTEFGYPKEAWGKRTNGYTNRGALYDCLELKMPIQRKGKLALVYIKTFLALFIAMAIAMLSFFIAPEDIDPRFGVGVAAVFGAVSSMIIVSNNTQETPYMTMSDKIHFFTLLMIFLTIFISCFSLRLHRMGLKSSRARLDQYGGWGCMILYIGGVVLFSILWH